ncbi:hypothetical protein H4V97_001224 [Flavobacterium sp. CG_23.5]|uniref:PKD-like domain-containing protein n=1 Tax=Flavobacterium sp. CG_23.5 TaxID=2760708 RepID=UPI001AE8D619|nr:PKD-like domain-containing protein [Flavobacterium sp. CG_23.5]MBP2282906.1 hypothetical protein [Flavobacterium sp. CG_23.5]
MKKKYFLIILLFLSSLYCFGQDCAERNVSDDLICSGQSASIILTGSVNLQDYQLRIGTSIIATKTGNGADVTFIVTPSSTTTYNIIAVGCPSPYIDTSTVTVNPILVPAVSIAANTGSTICAGTSVTFTATPVNGGTTPSYQWYVGATPVGTNSATYITSALTNGNQVKVVMTSTSNCPSPPTATSNILTMTVNTLLVPSVTISATQTTFCIGTAVTFNVDNLNNGGLNPTYQWRINGIPVGANSASFTSNALSNNDNITLDVTSSATCPSPSMVTSNAIQVTVNPNAAISLTSGVGSNSQTLCANSLLSSITFTISGGGTGAVVTGLPAGLTGSFSGGVVIISGTPTTSGSFTYTVTTTGTCVQTTATGVITVNPIATISLTSGAGTNNQTRCINVPLSTISFAISGGGTGAIVTGLPAGVNGTFSGGNFNISGLPTAIGSFGYTVTTTGTCTQTTATGTITINPDAAISLTSGANTNNQTLCANTALTNISYNISGGGTGATVSGLPAGLSGSFSASTFTIAGTPTVSGTFPYTVTTTGSCVQATSSGTLTVSPDAAIALTSAAGTNNQTRCINTAITTITFAVSGGGTGAGVTGLPAGIIGVFNSGTFTISGTPTASGSFPYTITTTGTCAQKTATGTIIVTPNAAINLTSGAGSNDQTKCINVAITNITFAVSGGATGATVTGLPAGLTTNYSGGIFTINGTPTASGSFPYTVTTAGACVQATATGTITVSPNAAIALSSAGGSNNQTRCINTTISTITYAITGGGTGATVTGLPTGVNGNYSGGTYTINGTPTVSGSFPYTVTTTGTCNQTTATGTINVNTVIVPSVTITSTSTSICSTAAASVTFTATPVNGGPTPVYQWKNNGSVITGATSSTYTTSSLAAGSVITVFMTSSATCGSTATSNSITMTVYTAAPTVGNGNNKDNKPSGPIAICPPATGLVYNIPVNMSGGETYVWNLPTGFSITSGAGTSQITVSVATNATLGNNNITVTAYNPCGNSGPSSNLVVNVNSFNGVTVPSATQSVCSDGSISVVGTLTGNATSGTWTAQNGTFSNIVTSTTNPILVSATYTPAITIGSDILTITTNTPTGGGCPNVAGTATINLTVNQKVTITSQPVTAQTLCSGSTATFSVSATGSGLTYQWKKGGTNLGNIGNVSGATSSTLTLTNITAADSADYTVIVSGAAPCSAVTSNISTLLVNQIIAIGTQPATTQSVCSGTSASLNVVATGAGLTYQWRKGTTNLSNGGTITGATSATLTINPTVTADAASDYNVVITGTAPCNPLTSNNAALVVNQVVAITAQPAITQTLCSGSTATFSITATGTGLTYQWKKGATNLVDNGTVSGATSSTLTLTNIATSDAANYTVVVSGAAPCSAITSDVSAISVNQIVAIGTQPAATQTVCSGTSASFNVVATGTGISYQWRKGTTPLSNGGSITGANSATLTINPTVSGDAASDYNVVITGTAPCNPLTSNNAALVINQAVAITNEPSSTQTLCSGSTATFSVIATGTGLNYQWKKGTSNLVDGGTITGATSSTLTITNVTIADAANYTVVVSGAAPCSAVTSNISALLVNQIVAIGTQPTTTQIVCSGTAASLNVLATGTGLTYQWRKGTTNLTDGGTISGATTATLTINPIVSGDAASDYNVIITGTAPCTPLTSNNATVVVNQAVSIITQPAATQNLCSGGTAALSVNATGAGLAYQWRKGSTNLVNGANIAGATSPTLTLSNLQTTDAANNYNVVITGTSPCTPVTSNNSILIINRQVTINTQPSNVGVCVSNPATFGIVASGDGLTFQWYKGTVGSGVAVANSANITGATTNILNFAQAALTDDGPYYAIVSGIAPCAAITSNQVTLNVDQSIIITFQPISKTVCEDTPNVTFSVIANAGGDPLTYQWRRNGVNIAGATAPTFTVSTATVATAGNYDVVIYGPSGYTCTSIQSAAVTLTINPKPIGSATTQTICSGSATNVALNSTVIGTTFTWTAAIQTPPTGGTITGFSDSSGNIIAQSLTNTGTATGTIRYTITPTANSCVGTAFTVDVTVDPAPVGSATAQTICSGSTTSVALTSTVTGTTYAWIAAIQTAPTGGSISGFSNGTQNTIAQTLSNTGTTAGIIRYTVIPTANSCSGAAFIVDVTVNPNSTIVLSSASGSGNPTNCVNTVLNISYAIGGGGTNASITAGALPAGVTGSYNSGTRVFTISGTPSAIGTFSYTITTQGLCSNASASGTITVNADATISLNLGTGSDNQTKCINSPIIPIKYTISNGGSTPTIAWNPGPANFSGSYDAAASAYTISGFSAVAGTFNYTISTAGSCVNSSLTGSITVNPNPMGSATAQTICSGSTTNVILNPSTGGTTFTWTAASQTTPTGGSISGFGSGSGASIAQTLTNSGTTAGSIRYTVTPTANSCPGSPFTVDVTVNPKPTGSATAQTICSGSATNVALNSTVSGTTYTWTSAIISTPNGGTITGFSNSSGNTIAQSLTNTGTTAGIIRYTVTPTANTCTAAAFTVDVTVNAPTVGGTTTISSTTNPSNVGNGTIRLTDCHFSNGVITLNGKVGTVVRWETSTNAGGTWTPQGNAGSLTYTYTGITATTIFRAVIQNSSCTIVNSGISTLFIIPNIKPSPVSATPSTICEGESTQLTSSSGFSSSQNLASGGLFNTANPDGWTVDNGNFPANGDNGVNNGFSETNGNAGDEYDSGDGKFAIVRGNRDSFLRTPTFDLVGLTSANLTFDHAYKLNDPGAYAEVRLSLDGGATFSVLLTSLTGNLAPKNQFTTLANKMSLDLNPYLGYTNLKIEFFFHGTVNNAGKQASNIGSTWAIDNVKIPQAPDPQLTSQWLNQNTGAIISVSNTTNVTVTPPVTTTYAVTSFLNGCTSYGDEGTTLVTVIVNKRPTANIFPDQTICYDGTATFSVALTGVAPWTVTYSNGSIATTVTGIMTSPYNFTVANVKANATYTITALNDKNCTPFAGGITGAANVQVITGRAGWWTGLASTDWFDCKNWEQGLPSFTVDANILPTAANGNRLPVIDKTSPYAGLYGGIASARDMIINSNGSVTVVSTNNSELQISRDWRNSGTFTPGTGTVTFNGATASQIQNINSSIKNNETFYNLTTNNTGGAKGISVIDGFELTVKNLVTLTSGDLRLTGEAQLVQEAITANPIAGSGVLLRDQQGQRNSFNYNYWSSPVSSGADATHYSIGGILRDGTDITNVISISNFNQEIIAFGDGVSYADGILSNPIKISNRWIWSYSSLTPGANSNLDNYNLWKYLANTGTLNIGEGFTMKGTGGTAAITDLQNYVFAGKPNSGTITLGLTIEQTYLVGNPYPSALDANEFIKDNLKDCIGCRRTDGNAFSGALYFWDHFGLSNNHLLAEYQGGYATYSLMGGVKGIANDPLTVNNGSTGSKIPQQYVPVAQGFFIDGYIDSDIATGNGIPTTVQGGPIIFKNSQRAFMKESTGNSLFMKTSTATKTKDSDTRAKIRLGFDSSKGAHRQLLVGADPNSTNQFDIGYDAPMFDLDGDDMFWEISNSQYVIQGVPNFDDIQIIPLGVIIATEGKISVKIDALENVSSDIEIYLYDNLTGTYHNIRENSFTIALAVGDYSNRFSLRFTNKSLKVDDKALTGGIMAYYTNNNKILNIKNNFIDATINTVYLFNILGQSITNWNVADQKQNNIQIPIKNMPAGVYIVKIKTTKGVFNKKILIK